MCVLGPSIDVLLVGITKESALNDLQTIGDAAHMLARDAMTERVVSVKPEASAQSVAHTLFDHRIVAVPVIDSRGVVVGSVSDGDLLGQRIATDGPDWWLDMLAGGKPVTEQMVSARSIAVHEVMTTPVSEIARLLQLHRIKRLPVMRDGNMVGIVSRTDLLGVVENLPKLKATKKAVITRLHGLLQPLVSRQRIRHGEKPEYDEQACAGHSPDEFRPGKRA